MADPNPTPNNPGGHPNAPTAGTHVPAGQHADHAEHDSHGGIAKYIYVFLALCVLTGASFFTYSSYWPFHATPQIGWAFMMAVSCTKAMLVILFFMHVKYEANWKYVLTIPAAFMSIFLILALVPDIGRRDRMVSEERRQHMAEAAHGSGHSAPPPTDDAGHSSHQR